MTLAKAKFILLLTSGCPTTNPRLVKEANALIARGYRIHVIYGYIADWADKLDSGLIEKVNWTCELVGGHPSKRKITWAFSCLVYRSARILQHVGPLKYFATRLSWPLFIAGRRYQPDAIIAHNLGALPPASLLARLKNIPLFFDAEDFHRAESREPSQNHLAERIENKLIPHCRRMTTASPAIADAYRELFTDANVMTVNNCFSLQDQQPLASANVECGLKFVWFSQTIGPDRGLIEFLEAVTSSPTETTMEITLIGTIESAFEDELRTTILSEKHRISLRILEPMTEVQIMEQLQKAHVGLALEQNTPQNRDICLTNKVFSYLLNGCQILYSNTTAQSNFYAEYPQTGRLVDLADHQSISDAVRYFSEQLPHMDALRQINWQLARDRFNFERDASMWLESIDQELHT
jgi:glycosyltransferase involved in cell wall biosynthesis